jgi:excisionase family DNA binding protein
MKDSLLTIDEVAETLRIRSKTVRKWVYLGKLQFVKIGRSVRVRRSVVETLIREGTRRTGQL